MTPTAGYDFNGNTSVTDLTQPINFTNRKIRIRTTFIINGDITFDNCCVKLDPGASIIVQSGKTLSINNSSFFGCNNLWNRIEVQSGASIKAMNSVFRDAESALFFKKGFVNSNTIVQDCDFQNNRDGISVVGTSSNNAIFLPSTFTGNTFEGIPINNPTILPSAGSSMTDLPNSGIRFLFCSNSVLSGANSFKNMKIGLSVKNSQLTVIGQSFDRMLGTQNPLLHGSGIVAEKSRLTVNGGANFSNNQFSGIFATTCPVLEVRGCQFKHNKAFCINFVSPPSGASVKIEENELTLDQPFEKAGIFITRPAGSFLNNNNDNNRIRKNRISISGSKSGNSAFDAIFLDATIGSSQQFEIERNSISGTHSGMEVNAITVNGQSNHQSNNIILIGNTISYPNPVVDGEHVQVNSWGIGVTNLAGSNNLLFSNNISSNLVSSLPIENFPESYCSNIKCAFHIVNSPSMTICTNNTNNTGKGYHFAGKLGFCQFAKNYIGRHLDGITGTDDNKMATNSTKNLKWHENKWSSAINYLRAGARNETGANGNTNTPGTPVTPNYRFFVDNGGNGGYSFMPPKIQPSQTGNSTGNWFLTVTKGANDKTTAPNCIGENAEDPTNPNKSLSHEDSLLMSGNAQSLSNSQLWDLQRNLLRKLILEPTIHPSGSLEDGYLNNQFSSSAYKYASAEAAFATAFNISNSTASDLKTKEGAQKFWSDSLFQLSTVTQTTAIIQANQNITTTLASINTSIKGLDDQIMNFCQSNLLTLQSNILNLPQNQVWESNLKSILSISTRKVLGDSLTDADFSVLRLIASQCPETNGEMAIAAANWLPISEMKKYLGCRPANNCYQNLVQNSDRSYERVEMADFEIFMSPNPANEILNVSFSRNFGMANFEILNINGHIERDGKLTEGENTISISTESIKTGFYFFTVESSDGRKRTQHFAIIH